MAWSMPWSQGSVGYSTCAGPVGSIFHDSFESNDFTAWTGTSGSPTVVNTWAKAGVYSEYVDAEEYCYKTIGSVSTVYVRFYLKVATCTDAGRRNLCTVRDSVNGKVVGSWGIRTNSHNFCMEWKDNTGAGTVVTSATTLTLGQVYCFELKCVVSATVGEYRTYVDGVEIGDLAVSGVNNLQVLGTVDQVRVGCDYSDGGTMTAYFDCVVVNGSYIGL